jgi:hypothetical protein
VLKQASFSAIACGMILTNCERASIEALRHLLTPQTVTPRIIVGLACRRTHADGVVEDTVIAARRTDTLT